MGGVGRIPWTAIHAYAVAKEVAGHERFERLIGMIDDAVLESLAQREG